MGGTTRQSVASIVPIGLTTTAVAPPAKRGALTDIRRNMGLEIIIVAPGQGAMRASTLV